MNANPYTTELISSQNVKDAAILHIDSTTTNTITNPNILFAWEPFEDVFFGEYFGKGFQYTGNHIDISFPTTGLSRWAPYFLISNDIIYAYYSRGTGIDDMRLYVSTADYNNSAQVEKDGNGIITKINFLTETYFDVLSFNNFGGSPDYGIIDPEIYIENSSIYVYYVVILYGIDSVRPHEEFIRGQTMTNLTTPIGQSGDTQVYDGLDGDLDDGVAEAPSIIKKGNTHLMIFSSYPSGWIEGDTDINATSGQYIAVVESTTGPLGPFSNRQNLIAYENAKTRLGNPITALHTLPASKAKFGIGGQCLSIPFNSMIFQGLIDANCSRYPRQYKLYSNTISLLDFFRDY